MNNNIGLFDTITAEYVVAGAKMELDLTSTTTQDMYLENKCNEGIGALRSCYTLIPAIAELPIDPVTYSAQLPSGFVRLRGNSPVRLIDNDFSINANGTQLQGSIGVVTNNSGFFKGDLNYYMGAEVVDGYIYFGSAVNQTMCEISYVSTNIDANGDLKIPALAYRPLLAFLCSEWLFKMNDPKSAKWDLRWRNGKRWFAGIMAQPDTLETQKMGYINNHMANYISPNYWLF
jgi:hypothetical protein